MILAEMKQEIYYVLCYTRLRRVHFDIDGYPMLDLSEEKDLNKDLAGVSMKVSVPDPSANFCE